MFKQNVGQEAQGTIGFNVYTLPFGSVYPGIAATNPYSFGLGSIGPAYEVNQLNTVEGLGGYPGVPTSFGGGIGVNGLRGVHPGTIEGIARFPAVIGGNIYS